MPLISDDLVHKATALFRLVGAVDQFISEEHGVLTYPEGAQEFLSYIRKLAEVTQQYLQKEILDQCANTPDGELMERVSSLGDCWTGLHDAVKPVVDANTLRVPNAFLLMLNKQVRSLPRLQSARIALEVGAELNYVQRQHTPLRALGGLLETTLSTLGPPEFPTGLGLIGLPYSQGSGLFHNCLLYHELGHFIFEETEFIQPVLEFTLPALHEKCPRYSEPGNEPELEKALDIVQAWCQEIFCDLLAVRLLGPAYTCIVADLFELLGLMDAERAQNYSATHPATTTRFRQQLDLLTDLGWFDALEEDEAAPLHAIEQAIGYETPANAENTTVDTPLAPSANGSTPSEPVLSGSDNSDISILLTQLKPAFEGLLTKIGELACEATGGRGAPPDNYRELSNSVRACLAHAIVPSVGPQDADVSKQLLTLINSAYLFQMKHLSELFDVVDKCSEDRILDQARLRKRTEQWTLKAIEDLLRPRLRGPEKDSCKREYSASR